MLSQASAAVAEPKPDAPAASAIAPPPVLLPVGDRLSRRLLTGSIVVSLLVHAVGAAAMLRSSTAIADFGVLSEKTDAISIEMTASTILEALESTASIASAAAAPTATQEGNPTPTSAAAVPVKKVEEEAVETPVSETIKATEVKPDVVPPPDDPLEVVRGSGEPSDVVDVKVAQHAKDEEQKQPEKEEKTEKEKEEVKVEQQQAGAQVSGGVTARSIAQADSAARVSASRGALLSYAAGIRTKVARNKPQGFGRHGEVQVSFGVTPSGELSYASLSQSSGNERLDAAALDAVRRAAPFGPPPPNAQPSQLRFSIPFYFR